MRELLRLSDRRNEIWLPHIPSLATRHFVYCLFNTQSPLGWIWPVDLEWSSSSSSIATMQCMTIPLSKIPLSARRAWPQAPRRALDVRTHDQNPSRPNFSAPTFSDETQEQAMARRLKESERVEERVRYVDSVADLEGCFENAGQRLVVIEIESAEVCQTGWDEEPELHWKDDQKAALEPCKQLKHIFQRTARDCPDVEFLTVQAEDDNGDEICDRLGVDVLPTVQFWKEGKLLWEHKGVDNLNQDLGEGVLYFGDQAGGNEKASMYIQDLDSQAEVKKFVEDEPDEKKLVVVDVSLSDAGPCVKIFPAVMALAKNFTGLAKFARVMADKNDDLREYMEAQNISQVPTFLFFRGGELVGRHVGSSRGDLIGQILTMQSAAGIPPPRPAAGAKKRQPMRRGRYTKGPAN